MNMTSTQGVDANINDIVTAENLNEVISFAKKFSQETGAVIAITGAIDIVANQEKTYVITNGCAMMSRITGTGCMLSAPEQQLLLVKNDPRKLLLIRLQ